jgi:hypothetical protein
MRRAALTLSLLISSLAMTTAHADSMRCGKWVVTSDVTIDELVSKCGEPASKQVSTRDIYGAGIGATAGRTRKVGVSTTEYWTFDRGSRAFRMIVTIIDGKVASIERAQQ